MFLDTGNERVTVYNPEWKAPHNPFVMPYHEVVPVAEVTVPEVTVTINTTLVPAPSSNGQRKHGELEQQVYDVIKEWLSPTSIYDWKFCTPVLIANAINEKRPPSTGAIGAVFDRWSRTGFAIIEKKPVRFVELTEEARQLGLQGFQAKLKLRNRTLKSKRSRGEKV
jgi:hypothetical protein